MENAEELEKWHFISHWDNPSLDLENCTISYSHIASNDMRCELRYNLIKIWICFQFFTLRLSSYRASSEECFKRHHLNCEHFLCSFINWENEMIWNLGQLVFSVSRSIFHQKLLFSILNSTEKNRLICMQFKYLKLHEIAHLAVEELPIFSIRKKFHRRRESLTRHQSHQQQQ